MNISGKPVSDISQRIREADEDNGLPLFILNVVNPLNDRENGMQEDAVVQIMPAVESYGIGIMRGEFVIGVHHIVPGPEHSIDKVLVSCQRTECIQA